MKEKRQRQSQQQIKKTERSINLQLGRNQSDRKQYKEKYTGGQTFSRVDTVCEIMVSAKYLTALVETEYIITLVLQRARMQVCKRQGPH